MCGRYYIDTNWLDEIGNVVYSFDIDWKICKEQFQGYLANKHSTDYREN